MNFMKGTNSVDSLRRFTGSDLEAPPTNSCQGLETKKGNSFEGHL